MEVLWENGLRGVEGEVSLVGERGDLEGSWCGGNIDCVE
jgi:hypothetical protein